MLPVIIIIIIIIIIICFSYFSDKAWLFCPNWPQNVILLTVAFFSSWDDRHATTPSFSVEMRGGAPH
jgi:hypothetical protein